jgi:hypothetical protein
MDRDIWFNLSLVWLVAVLCGTAYLLFQVWGLRPPQRGVPSMEHNQCSLLYFSPGTISRSRLKYSAGQIA